MINKKILSKIIIFHGLVDKELDLLLSKIKINEFKSGEFICIEGEPGHDMYTILKGRVEILKTDENGKKIRISEMQEEDCFGEMTLIDVQARSADVRAITTTRLASLSNLAIYEIYKEDTELYAKIILNIAREFSRRLRSMDEKFLEFATHPSHRSLPCVRPCPSRTHSPSPLRSASK